MNSSKSYIIASLLSIIIGMGLSFFIMYVAKFKTYILIKKAETQNTFISVIDVLWRLLLPVAFGLIAIVIPAAIMSMLIQWSFMEKAENIGVLYLCGLLFSFVFSLFVLINMGKLKTTTKWPPD